MYIERYRTKGAPLDPASGTDRPVVLLVEDQPLVRMLAADILEEAGFEVTEAATAPEALNHLERSDDVRVVFTDVDMPGGMNGLELARIVHARWPHIALVVTSGVCRPSGGPAARPRGFRRQARTSSPGQAIRGLISSNWERVTHGPVRAKTSYVPSHSSARNDLFGYSARAIPRASTPAWNECSRGYDGLTGPLLRCCSPRAPCVARDMQHSQCRPIRILRGLCPAALVEGTTSEGMVL